MFIKCECYEHVVQRELINPKIHMVFTTQEWNDITKKNLQKFIHDKELKMSGMNWTLFFFFKSNYHKRTEHHTSFKEMTTKEHDKNLLWQFNKNNNETI